MENIIEIYNRTYRNCRLYQDKGDEKALLNEIGVLRGIMYCIEATTGGHCDDLIDYEAFKEMIAEQQRLKGV